MRGLQINNPNGDHSFICFNQDYSFFACCGKKGFKILACDYQNFREIFNRNFDGSLARVEMLFRCNILALVGGGTNPSFPKNKVVIWDDHQKQVIGELLFKEEVKRVQLHRSKEKNAHIIVALQKKIYVYNFETLELEFKYDCQPNDEGLISVSPKSRCVVAFPDAQKKGNVKCVFIDSNMPCDPPTENSFKCHENGIKCLCLNENGSLLATCSTMGTLIRIFDTKTGAKVQELRRGKSKSAIASMTFSEDSNYLVVSSATNGTIHVFSTFKSVTTAAPSADANSASITHNQKTFMGEKSIIRYKCLKSPSICCFGKEEDNKLPLLMFGTDGSFHYFLIDTKKTEGPPVIVKKNEAGIKTWS